MLSWSQEIGMMCSECACVLVRGVYRVYVMWKLPVWEGRLVQRLALLSLGATADGKATGDEGWWWLLFVCTDGKMLYEAGGSRLFGSRVLLHKIIMLLSNLMWYTVNLSSQVYFSNLPSFCFGLFVKSAFAMLCVWEGENTEWGFSQWLLWCSEPPKILLRLQNPSDSSGGALRLFQPLCKRIHT